MILDRSRCSTTRRLGRRERDRPTYLRAQTLAEPARSRSLALLVRYTDTSIRLSHAIPGSSDQRRAVADGNALQRRLWRLAGQALDAAPVASAPRLYVDSLNNMIDMQTPSAPLTSLRASMLLPPAAGGASHR